MGMSTYVSGFSPPDAKWKEMKAIWDSCHVAGVEVPSEVYNFFDGETPDERGRDVDLKSYDCCSDWSEEMRSGYEIDVTKIPENIKVIRFYNSW